MKHELKKLIEDQDLVRAMEESCIAGRQKLDVDFCAFLDKFFDIKKGDKYSMIDIIEKVRIKNDA